MTQNKLLLSLIFITSTLISCSPNNSDDKIANTSDHTSRIEMKGGTVTLAVRHEVVDRVKLLKIYYQQTGAKFCINKNSLYFNPALDLSSNDNTFKKTSLVKLQNQSISNFFPENSASYDLKNGQYFRKLNENSGALSIDVSDFFLNKNAIGKINNKGYIGYLSIEFFLCSQLSGAARDPIVTPVVYKVNLQ
jgi:hypothetical protein